MNKSNELIETLDDVLYLLEQEDNPLPKRIMVNVSMLKKTQANLEAAKQLVIDLERVRGISLTAIGHVQRINYPQRADEAREWINDAVDESIASYRATLKASNP